MNKFHFTFRKQSFSTAHNENKRKIEEKGKYTENL